MIDWIRLKKTPRNIHLRPFYENIITIIIYAHDISFFQIYKERNQMENHYSRKAFILDHEHGIDGLIIGKVYNKLAHAYFNNEALLHNQEEIKKTRVTECAQCPH